MKTISVEYVKDRISEHQKKLWDVRKPLKEIEFFVTKEEHPHIIATSSKGQHKLTDLAGAQICIKLGIPHKYLLSCPQDLATRQLNHWKGESSRMPLLWRGYEDKVRAVLSEQYTDVPHSRLINIMLANPDINIKEFHLDMENMHIRTAGEEIGKEKGKPVFKGMAWRNSEVGEGRLEGLYIIYIEVCSNGLIIPKTSQVLASAVHRGKIDVPAIYNRIIEYNPSIPDFRKLKSKEKIPAAWTINSDPNKQGRGSKESGMVKILKKEGMGKGFSEEVELELAKQKRPVTRWDLAMALSAQSQKLRQEERLKVDAFAGQLIFSAN